MAGWQLLVLGYFLGAPLGFLLCSVLVASKDPPKAAHHLQGLRT